MSWKMAVKEDVILGPSGKKYQLTAEDLKSDVAAVIGRAASSFGLGAWDVIVDDKYVAKPSDLPASATKVEVAPRDTAGM